MNNNKNTEPKIKIIPLGGVQDIGMNMTLIEYANEVLIVDSGFMFPKHHMLGVAYVIPDTSYLEGKNIVGLLLTHGHEDHIGSIPHLLRKFPHIKIYGTKLTIALVRAKLSDYRGEYKNVSLKEIKARDKISMGHNFKIEFIKVNHSILDSVGLAIKTPIGTIIHTGDFKVDLNPANDTVIDLYKFAEYGEKGVLLLLADSTNVERKGISLSESAVYKKMNSLFTHNQGMIIVASFASSLERIQSLVTAAKNNKKFVAFSGRSLYKYTQIAEDLGYLNLYDGVIIPIDKISKYPRHKVVCITTGTQGEPYSSLSLIASNSHRHIKVEKGDIVIFSSSVIPGNEMYVTKMINNLFDLGAGLIEEDKKYLHVSGHASSEDLKLMYRLIKPKYFIPMHGEKKHLIKNIKLIESLNGLNTEGFLLYNGNVLTIDKEGVVKLDEPINIKNIYVDGKGIGGVDDSIFTERSQLAVNGVVVAHINIYRNKNGYNVVVNIDSKGFIYNGGATDTVNSNNKKLMDEAEKNIKDTIKRLLDRNKKNLSTMRYEVRETVKKKFMQVLGKEPVIFVCINMIGENATLTSTTDINKNTDNKEEVPCKKKKNTTLKTEAKKENLNQTEQVKNTVKTKKKKLPL